MGFAQIGNPFYHVGNPFSRICYLFSRIAIRSLDSHNSLSRIAIANPENEFKNCENKFTIRVNGFPIREKTDLLTAQCDVTI